MKKTNKFLPILALIIPILLALIAFLPNLLFEGIINKEYNENLTINLLEILYTLGFTYDVIIMLSIGLLVIYSMISIIVMIKKIKSYDNKEDKTTYDIFAILKVFLTGKTRSYFNTENQEQLSLRLLNVSVILTVIISLGLIFLESMMLMSSNPFHFNKIKEDINSIENNLVTEQVYIMNYYKENLGHVVDSQNYFEIDYDILNITVYVIDTKEIKTLYLPVTDFRISDFYEIEDVNYYLEEGYTEEAAQRFASEALENNKYVKTYTAEYTPNYNAIYSLR